MTDPDRAPSEPAAVTGGPSSSSGGDGGADTFDAFDAAPAFLPLLSDLAEVGATFARRVLSCAFFTVVPTASIFRVFNRGGAAGSSSEHVPKLL